MDQPGIGQRAQAFGQHAAREPGLTGEVGESRSVGLVDREQDPQRPAIADQLERATTFRAERYVEASGFRYGTHSRIVLRRARISFHPCPRRPPRPTAPTMRRSRPRSARPRIPAPASELRPDAASWRWVGRCCSRRCSSRASPSRAFNAAIDPTGKLGTGLLDPISRLARDRAAKVELLRRRRRSELVVLGSSRAKQLDPRELDPRRASRSTRRSSAATCSRHACSRRGWASAADDEMRPFPHLVVGVDVEGFRGRLAARFGAAGGRRGPRVARHAAGTPSPLELAPDASELLLTLETTRASWRTMRLQLRQRRTVGDATEGEDATRTLEDFDSAGTAEGDPGVAAPGEGAGARRAHSHGDRSEHRPLPRQLRRAGRGARADVVEDLRALVAVAARARRPPARVHLARARAVRRALDPIGRTERHASSSALLQRLERDGDIEWVDCSDVRAVARRAVARRGAHLTARSARPCRELRSEPDDRHRPGPPDPRGRPAPRARRPPRAGSISTRAWAWWLLASIALPACSSRRSTRWSIPPRSSARARSIRSPPARVIASPRWRCSTGPGAERRGVRLLAHQEARSVLARAGGDARRERRGRRRRPVRGARAVRAPRPARRRDRRRVPAARAGRRRRAVPRQLAPGLGLPRCADRGGPRTSRGGRFQRLGQRRARARRPAAADVAGHEGVRGVAARTAAGGTSTRPRRSRARASSRHAAFRAPTARGSGRQPRDWRRVRPPRSRPASPTTARPTPRSAARSIPMRSTTCAPCCGSRATLAALRPCCTSRRRTRLRRRLPRRGRARSARCSALAAARAVRRRWRTRRRLRDAAASMPHDRAGSMRSTRRRSARRSSRRARRCARPDRSN